MKFEHCVSLELAKKLKEAGWNKETEFWWQNLNSWNIVNKDLAEDVVYRNAERNVAIETIVAPLATEILEELPPPKGDEEIVSGKMKLSEEYYCCLESTNRDYKLVRKEIIDFSLPDTLAQMWLYLKEEGKI